MIRNLRVIGLALVAALALSAVAASTASAEGRFNAEANGVKLTGSQVGTDVFTTTAGELRCTNASYTGELPTVPTTEGAATPAYSNCHVGGIIPAVVDMKSCFYLLTIDPTSAETKGWIDIKCTTPGDEITVTVNAPSTIKCTIHIPPQTVSGVKYTNKGAGTTREVEIDVGASGITYSETAGTGLGACATSNPLLQHGGTYNGKALVTGEHTVGEVTTHTGVFIG